jgi:hypothetical protein
VAGALLLGFGSWHVADGILSHWLLGIHRIKLDSPSPLAWDLSWFVVFGLLPIAIGRVLMRRRARRPGSPVAVARELRWDFYRHGALLVGGTALAAGCASWSGA